MKPKQFSENVLSFFAGVGQKTKTFVSLLFIALCSTTSFAQDFTADFLGDYGNVTVMEIDGNYDAENPDGTTNAVPRQAIAREFFKTHKDEYDFLVIFTNFDFQMPEGETKAFYEGVKNDIQGIGVDPFDNTSLYGSNGKLQGTIDMGNLSSLVTDPLDPKFESTLYILSHEMLHRWAAQVKFKDATGEISSALLGRDGAHWSFLLDTGGSVLYGNQWQDNKNGTFTSTSPQSQMLYYSPLDLYLMGMNDKSKVPPMLLIDSPTTDTTQLPQAGITISGPVQYVTIDQIIAAMGPRVPDASASQKDFKTAFIFITQPGTFTGNELYGIENIRSAEVARFSILTDGTSIMQVASTPTGTLPINPGVLPPSVAPRTLPPNINDGVAWLAANQKFDGSWADLSQTAERDTAATTMMLKDFANAQLNYQSGLQWLGTTSSGNADFLSRKIAALAGSGQEVSALVSDLLSLRNNDGGWGSDKNYASNPTDTALALKALIAAGYSGQSVISKAIVYLQSQQNAVGGWGNEDKGGMVRETSNALSVLNSYRATYSLDDSISKGTTWLIARQNVDGGFGNSPSTIYDTALAAMTLNELNASTDISNKALGYLLSQQSGDGSWFGSAFQTALAVQTVYKATVDPDLSIKSDDISVIPAAVTSLPANVVISSSIRNLGRADVPRAKVALYDGDPAAGNKLGDQTLAFPGQQAAAVTFSAVVSDGNEHKYTIVLDPDNLVKESNKLNNKAVKFLYPDATFDFEVLSSNMTVSTNPADMLSDVTITAQITNKGTMNAYNVQVKYYIDEAVSPMEITTRTVDIPAGATITNRTIWRTNRAGVNLPLTVLVDPFNNFVELSKDNNKAFTPITVNSATTPNLSVSYKDLVISPSPANQGGSTTITALVKNEGFSSASNIKVNFYEGVPGSDGVLIGSQVIPIMSPGISSPVSVVWTNIKDRGEKIISVQVDPDNQIQEIRKDDNDAFTTLALLTLPDFAISTNSIVFSPAAPKDGDPVNITVTVQNRGEQAASSVVVRLTEDGVVLGDKTISSLAGNSTGSVSLSYETTGKKGPHTITASVDPDSAFAEQSKDNNSASRLFGVQDANLWVTEQYISPNGDGVRDSTQFFFRLSSQQTVTVIVINNKGEAVKTFDGNEFENIISGTVAWDGLNDSGVVVDDGEYQFKILDSTGMVLAMLRVVVDNNRSPLVDALGTKYLLNSDLTCKLPDFYDEDWAWLADESGIIFSLRGTNPDSPQYQAGIYYVSPAGDVENILPAALAETVDLSSWVLSQQGKIAFLAWNYNTEQRSYIEEVWSVDADGRNLRFLSGYEKTGDSLIHSLRWSPDGKYILYNVGVVYDSEGNSAYELWALDVETSVKTKIDWGYLTTGLSAEWSPDGNRVAYLAYSFKNSSEELKVSDISGNKKSIYSFDGYTWYTPIHWLDDEKLLIEHPELGQELWLLDASGNGNHIKLSVDHSGESSVSPDRKSVAYITDSSNVQLHISDTAGHSSIIYELKKTGPYCVPLISDLVWSTDSKKILFSARVDAWGGYPDSCNDPYKPQILSFDLQTRIKTSSEGTFVGTNLVKWLSDDISVISGDSQNIYLVNQLTGQTNTLITDTELPRPLQRAVSPLENYITYYKSVDPSSACFDTSVRDLWTTKSILNLTAELQAIKNKSAITLKGIAADLNFEGYQLEYADSKSPDAWNPVQPISDIPMVNDIFTTWVPPYEGTFYVRLTAWDKAGNTAMSRKRVSWGLSSVITSLYKSLDIFSPNGDGVKDSVELHYRVLEPVHLEFTIYDEANNKVKTYYKDHEASAEAFIQWDGTDESGNIVPDGKYSIRVFDYEFLVEVDNTPPQVAASFSRISKENESRRLFVDLLGHVVDANLKRWVLEYGIGDNPHEWTEYAQGGNQLVKKDDAGKPIADPSQDTAVRTFDEDALRFLVGEKLRITAEDYGGNKRTAVTDFMEEVFLFDRYARGDLDTIKILPWLQLNAVLPDLAGFGPHAYGGLVTIRSALVGSTIQVRRSTEWHDVSSISLAPGLFWSEWNNAGETYSAVRIKAVDMQGKEYYSNVLGTSPFLIMQLCAEKGSNDITEKLQILRLQIRSNEDTRYSHWTDFKIFTSPDVPVGPFEFRLPSGLRSGTRYEGRITAVGMSGNSYVSGIDRYATGDACSLEFALSIDYPEAVCGLASHAAEITAQPKNMTDIAFPRTLRYFIQKTGKTELLRQYDLSREGWGGVSLDTSILSEGSYTVQAVVAYLDASDNTMKELSEAKTLVVDLVLPRAQITYPEKSALLCPIKTSGVTGDWYGVHVEGQASDNNSLRQYALYYGAGENPSIWLPAMTRIDGKISTFQGTQPIQGQIGLWDVSDIKAGTVSLKLEVVDAVGNKSCPTTSFAIPPFVLSLTADKKLFSPNADGILDTDTISYTISQDAIVDVKVFKLLATSSGYVLDATPARTLQAAAQHLEGTEEVLWDGKNDAGVVVSDGLYDVAVSAAGSCGGSTTQKWAAAEVDTTAPAAAITYPKAGDPVGNVVEVKGSATDIHFQKYILEAGAGSSPDTWSAVSTRTTPVSNDVLGKWSTFGLAGIWTLRLTAFDVAGNKSVTTSTLDLGTRKNLIKDLGALPLIFSPNNDGKLDTATISYELTDACTILMEFLDANSMVRKTYPTTAPSPGAYTYIWDGKDNAGIAIPDGTVSVRLTATLSSDLSVMQTETVTIIIDAAQPSVDIKQPLNNSYTSATDIAVTGTISDLNLSGYTIYNGVALLDQANQTREDFAFGALSSLPEGNYTLTVNAIDLGQNETNRTIAFTVDRTLPVLKLDTPKDNDYYGANKDITITGSIVEKNLEIFNLRYGTGDAPVQWTGLATGTTITAYPSPYTWKVGKNDGIPDGAYTLSLYAKDKAGLPAEVKVKVTIDNTAPAAAITSLHDGDYVKQAVDVQGTAFDQNLDKYTLEISENQCSSAFKWAQIKTGTSSVQDNVLGAWQALPIDGDYCLRLAVLDKVGLTAEAKVNVKVDTYPPATPLLSGKADDKINADLAWTASIEPDLAGYNVYRSGRKINTTLITDTQYHDQNLAEGVYAYTVKAQDFAGWESQPSSEVKIKIDLTGPDARIRLPQDTGRISGLIDIKGTAYSADDFKQYRIYVGQGAAPSSWALIRTSPAPVSYGTLAQWDTLGLVEGQVYSIKLEAEDVTGNITTHQISVTADNTPPAAPLLTAAGALVSDVTVTWQGNDDADLAGYLLYRNDRLANVGGLVVGNLQPYLISGTTYVDKSLPDGAFNYSLFAMDRAGNMSNQSNTLSVTIDTHPPHAAITDPADTAKFGGKIMVKADSPDLDIASIQFQYQSIESSPTTTTDWINLGSPITAAILATYLDPSGLGLAHSDYRLRAVATDRGGKTDPVPDFITATYTDLTPPAAPVGLVALTNGGTVSLTWAPSPESDLDGYNVYRTSGSARTKVNAALILQTPQPTYMDSGLADGRYLYEVTAVDTHQNESEPSRRADAKVYSPVITRPYTPVSQSTVQVQGANAAANAVVTILDDAGSGLVSLGTATADASGQFGANVVIAPGENKIIARSTDSDGNVSKDAGSVVVVYNDAPGAPANVEAAVDGHDVHLSWDKNSEADMLGYNVYRDGVKLNRSDNVLLSQPAYTASSSFDSYQYGPEVASDSSLTSYWMPNENTSSDHPSWWEMDLGAPELINHLEIHWAADFDSAGNEVLYGGKDYEVQVWSGYAWITQVRVTGNEVKDNFFDFSPSYRTGRIRIVVTDSTDTSSAKQVRLAEVSFTKDNLIQASEPQPAYTDPGLLNRQYSYTVTAVDVYGFESGPSGTAIAPVSTALPSTPGDLTITPTSEGGLHASWTYDGNLAAGYDLYRGVAPGGPYGKVTATPINETSYLDTGLISGTTYYYVVAAVDSVGNEGGYSNEAAGTPLDAIAPAKPVILKPTMSGAPITLFTGRTDISGSADPDAAVELFRNGEMINRTTPERKNTVEKWGLGNDYNTSALSPDGSMLAYATSNAVLIKNLGTGVASQALEVQNCYNLVWSPDGGKLAYTTVDGNRKEHVGVYDLSSGRNTLLPLNINASDDSPSWFPDCTRIAYTEYGGTSPGIRIMDLASGTSTQLAATDNAGYVRVSPDGQAVAYTDYSDSTGAQGLYLFDVENRTVQLIDDNVDSYFFDWSYDGSKLAFVSYRSGSGAVFVLNRADGTQTLVSGSGVDPYYLVWEADGQSVVYALWDNENGRDTLWKADVNSRTAPGQIMPELQNIRSVASAKTALLIINQDEQGSYAAFLINANPGLFEFHDIPIAPGENIFTALSSDASGNNSALSDPVSITYDTRTNPDLAIAPDDIYLYPPYPIAGEQMAVNAVVSNTSQTNIPNVEVDLYAWNALGQMELLKSETIPVLVAGTSELVTTTWDSMGKIGDNRLVVVVDPYDKIAEWNEANNTAIKDFYVADHVGMSMNTDLDNIQYNSSQNAAIRVTVWNTGPAINGVLNVQVEDADGNVVSPFDARPISVAYGTQSSQTYTWSTGSTYSGSYVVHSVLSEGTESVLAENTTPFTILPDAAVDLVISTEKAAYGPKENVAPSFTIKNSGKNSIIPTLQAAVSIADAAGTVLFSEIKTVTNLFPGTSVDLNSLWNTGLTVSGNYTVTVQASFDGGTPVTKTAAFEIKTMVVLTGNIATAPATVAAGNTAHVTYTLRNTGNVDAVGYTARVSIIDPDTLTVMQTQDVTLDILENSSKSGQLAVNTNGYSLKTYVAVLQILSQGGIVKNIANTSFVVKDLTPPLVTVITPVVNSIYDTSVPLSVLASDNVSGVDKVECRFDNGLWKLLPTVDPAQARYGASWDPVPADNGRHTISFRGKDKAGNTSEPVSVGITIQIQMDATPPVLTLSTLPDGAYTNNATLNIAGTVADDVAVQGVKINAVSVTINDDGSFSQAISLTTGTNTITTNAVDTAGNTTTDTRTVILDRNIPVITIASPVDNSVTNAVDTAVTGTVDKESTISINVNGISAGPDLVTDSFFSLPALLAYGQNTIQVAATDLAGNTSMIKRTVIFDDVNPVLAVTNPAQDITTNQPGVLLQGTVADFTGITVAVTSDNVVSEPIVTNGTFEQQLTFLAEKQYPVMVTATDDAGNQTTVQRNIIFDKTPPSVGINPATTPTNNSIQMLSGAREPDSSVTITCPTAMASAVSYPTTTTWQAVVGDMAEGGNTVSVTAMDLAGNVSDPVTTVIVLDTEAPDTVVASAPPVLSNSNTAVFSFTSNEEGSAFECKLDLGSYASCTSPLTYANIPDNAHTFLVRGTDGAGNIDQTPASYLWTIDTIPPAAVVTGAPASPTRTTGAVLRVTGDDVIAYRYKLDSGAYSAETAVAAPIVIEGLLDGNHTVSAVGKDSAGNWQTEGFAMLVGWSVDTQPPVLTLSTLPDNAYTNNPTLNIAGNVVDNLAVQNVVINDADVVVSVDGAFSQVITLATGTNTLTTIALDTAGNAAIDKRTIILDRTTPAITITNPADNSVTNGMTTVVTGTVDKPAKIAIAVNNNAPVPATMTGTAFSGEITLAYGQNTIQVSAADRAGNTGFAKRSITFDNVSPTLAVTNPAQDSSTNQSSLLLSGVAADLTGITVIIACDGTIYTPAVTNGAFRQEIVFTSEKTYMISVTATDSAGNTTTIRRNVVYEITSPTITINAAITPTNNSQQLLSGTMDLGSTVAMACPTAIAGTASYPTATTWQAVLADMQEGTNIVSATATDQAGNESKPATASLVLDTRAPITTASPAAGTYSIAVMASLTTNEPATIYYATDGASPSPASPVYAGPIMINASTTLRFFSVDPAGNRETEKSVAYTINSDITPPATNLTVGSPNYAVPGGPLYVTGETVFALFAFDNQSGVAGTEYRIDNSAWIAYHAPFTVAGDGRRAIGYRSIDNRSNIESEKTRVVIIDNTPPVSTLNADGSGCHEGGRATLDVAAHISITASDTGSGVQTTKYSIDGGSWVTYNGSFTLTGYSDGVHTISYRSMDNVGNIEVVKTSTLNIGRKKTSVIYTGAAFIPQGRAAVLTAKLKVEGMKPPKGQEISFTLGNGSSVQSCTGMTDARGNASCTIHSVTAPLGPVSLKITFNGDEMHAPATNAKNVTIFAYPSVGLFVIGDRGAAVNRSVTFWGAQWSKDNSLSNGPGETSFKGFAGSLNATPPDCGGAWTSGPGNSPPLPRSIPTYMAVVVSDGITNSRRIFRGNIREIVIVKTSSGYRPDPGHIGTGTMIGVLCQQEKKEDEEP